MIPRLSKAPIAAEAVKRVNVLFAVEREIDGFAAQERLRVRQERSRPLIVELDLGCASSAPSSPGTTTRPKRSITASAAGMHLAASLMTHGFACRTMLPSVSYGRSLWSKKWTFAGFDEGGRPVAAIYTLIATAKLNDIDPQACAGPPAGSSRQAHPRTHARNWQPQNLAHAP
ncbi:hypothetical protein [Bradyrhizobium ottawaense]